MQTCTHLDARPARPAPTLNLPAPLLSCRGHTKKPPACTNRSIPALKGKLPASWTKPYIPDFRKAFDHFCIHTGGRGIIDGLEKELKLTRAQVEPSRASLYRFGNTSSTRWGRLLSAVVGRRRLVLSAGCLQALEITLCQSA